MQTDVVSVFEKLALLTRLQGVPLSAQALAAQTLRNQDGRPDLNSLKEVLLSHGYESQISERALGKHSCTGSAGAVADAWRRGCCGHANQWQR